MLLILDSDTELKITLCTHKNLDTNNVSGQKHRHEHVSAPEKT